MGNPTIFNIRHTLYKTKKQGAMVEGGRSNQDTTSALSPILL